MHAVWCVTEMNINFFPLPPTWSNIITITGELKNDFDRPSSTIMHTQLHCHLQHKWPSKQQPVANQRLLRKISQLGNLILFWVSKRRTYSNHGKKSSIRGCDHHIIYTIEASKFTVWNFISGQQWPLLVNFSFSFPDLIWLNSIFPDTLTAGSCNVVTLWLGCYENTKLGSKF